MGSERLPKSDVPTNAAIVQPQDQRRRNGGRAYLSGVTAEEAVARHYVSLGHPIAELRWRGVSGEIDLIARRENGGLIFVEVKRGRDFARAAERFAERQMARVVAAASEYLGHMPMGQLTETRFDLALVDELGRIEIRQNAFGH